MKQLSVLLVDDDPDVGAFIKRMLSREAPDFSFACVESGQECLDYITENKVDCILSDYQMPVMDGMELLLAIREREIDIPFIFITGQGNEEVAREAFKNGVFDYFTKDIGFAHFARIVNSIEQAVNKRAADAERRRMDEALKASEQRLLLHVQQTPLGAIEWDTDFRVVSWNPAAEKIFGFTAEEAIGRISMFIIPESARPHVDNVWDDLINRRGGERSTNENLTKDGRIILCEWYNTPLVAPDGKVIGVASFVQDVTERQKAEDALAESEDKFRKLVEKSLVGVYLIQGDDSRYVFKYVNSMMAEILGYSVDELTGMEVLETAFPEDAPLIRENLRRRIEGEIESISYGFRCRKKSGEIIDAMVYGTKTTYMGRPAVIGTLLDITERKKSEDALVESEEKFRHLVEQAADAFFLHDINGRIVDVNQQACDSLGYTREELLGMSVQDVEKGFGDSKLADLWRGMTPDRPVTADGVQRRKDGSTFPVEVRVGSLNVGGEQLILALVRDVTERKQADDALKASRKFLETIIDTEPECVKLIAPDGTLELMNRAGLDMIQAESLDQVKGKSVLGLIAPEHREAFMQVGEKVFRGEEAQLEFDMIGFGGRRLRLETHAVPLRDEKDEIIALLGVTRDVTGRKRAEEEISEQRAFLEKTINSLTHPFYVIDAASYKVVMANTASKLEVSSEHNTCYEMTHRQDMPCSGAGHLCPLETVKETKEPVAVKHTHYDEEGNERTIEVHGYPILDGKGDVVQMIEYALDITERVNAEEALLHEKVFTDITINSMPGIFYVCNDRLQLVRWNMRLEELVGLPPEEMSSINVLDYVAEEDRESTRDKINDVIQGGKSSSAELLLMNRDGQKVPYFCTGSPMVVDNSTYLVGVGINIAERKIAEETMMENEERCRAIFNSVNDAVFVHDLETGAILDVNQRMCEMYGYTHDEALKLNVEDLSSGEPPYTQQDALNWLEKAAKGEPQLFEWHAKDKSGRLFWVEVNIRLATIGKRKHLLVTVRDVTCRKQADEALRLSEERIRSIMETTDEWIWETDNKGVHTYSNSAVESILGYRVEDIVGRYTLELMHEDDRATVAQMLPGLVAQKKGWRGLLLRWRHRDGTYRCLESNSVPVLGPQGEVVGFRGADRDVTERKSAEDAVKASEAKFRALVEDTNVGVIIIQDGKAVYRNPRQAQMLGYTPEELAGSEDFLQFTHPDDRDIVREAVSALLEGEQTRTFEFRVLCKDGGVVYLEAHGCLADYNGRPAVIGISIDITARKRAEDALLESEARFRALTESTSDWIWEADLNGAYTYSSPKVRDILGYSSDELIGKSAFEFMPPEEAARVEAEFRKLALSQRPIERLENVNVSKDGGLVVLETSGVPFFDRDGVFCGYRGIDRDITERKKAETYLRRSEGRLKAILNNIPDFAWLKDTESRFIAVNEAVGMACGLSPDELVGKTDLDLWPRELADMYRADDMEVVKSGKRKSVVEPMVDKDGEKKWIATIKSPIYDEEGNVAGSAGIARDITEMKRTEEMLQFRNVLLSIQQEASLDGILVVNEKREIISFNTRFAEMWGVPSEVMDKKSGELLLQSVLHNLADPDEFVKRIDYLYAHSTERSREEVQLKDGRTLDRYSAPMLSPDGGYFGRVWYYRDITEKRRLEQQRADFYAMVTHDLKSPLMALTGYAELLEEHSEKFDEDARTMVSAIHRSCDRLLRLIEDLLSVSRFEAEKLGLDLFPADLSRTLGEACAGLEGEMRKKTQTFRFELAEGLPEKLVIDKKYVLRAVVNLLQNAVNYTPSGGEITLRAETRQEGDQAFVVVSVRDNGPGIPSTEHSRIFDKYYRVPGTTGIKGTGLGLAITKAVAEEHGGRVELESEPGKGSNFMIYLPVSEDIHSAHQDVKIA